MKMLCFLILSSVCSLNLAFAAQKGKSAQDESCPPKYVFNSCPKFMCNAQDSLQLNYPTEQDIDKFVDTPLTKDGRAVHAYYNNWYVARVARDKALESCRRNSPEPSTCKIEACVRE